ncbi:hypothetical protein JTE90_024797 [Oedothorax gibbosus]|uniref:Uncharacterized protein n=1 Tax=Oedothorax gibbosus TaxID=931172 RepID=A0AAV6TY75_9ARAC|nr:hypothetical protein JTE90_024797 [Oedothorax gibbosus]
MRKARRKKYYLIFRSHARDYRHIQTSSRYHRKRNNKKHPSSLKKKRILHRGAVIAPRNGTPEDLYGRGGA